MYIKTTSKQGKTKKNRSAQRKYGNAKKIVSQTDWNRVRAFKDTDHIPYNPEDGPYDPNDEKATGEWMKNAIVIRRPGQRGPQKSPTKQPVTIRLSRGVVEYFKATGPGWQGRIDETLKKAIR